MSGYSLTRSRTKDSLEWVLNKGIRARVRKSHWTPVFKIWLKISLKYVSCNQCVFLGFWREFNLNSSRKNDKMTSCKLRICCRGSAFGQGLHSHTLTEQVLSRVQGRRFQLGERRRRNHNKKDCSSGDSAKINEPHVLIFCVTVNHSWVIYGLGFLDVISGLFEQNVNTLTQPIQNCEVPGMWIELRDLLEREASWPKDL